MQEQFGDEHLNEVFNEPVLGAIEQDFDPFAGGYLTNLTPLRRILLNEDRAYARKHVGHMRREMRVMRKKLILGYADEIAYDIERMWFGMRAVARTEGWDFAEMGAWYLEGRWHVVQLRVAACVNWAPSRSAKIIGSLEEFLRGSRASLDVAT